MKNLLLVITLAALLSSCSSGTTVANTLRNLTGQYIGNYISNSGEDEGNMTLNIVEDNAGNVTGNLIVTFDPDNRTCLLNGVIESGAVTGFSLTFQVNQGGDGTIDFLLTVNGNTLSGSYVSNESNCSNNSGAGRVTFTG